MPEKTPLIKRPWEVKGIASLCFALLLALSLITYHPLDPSLTHFVAGEVRTHNLVGTFGSYLSDLLVQLLGLGAMILPIMMGIMAMRYFRIPTYHLRWGEGAGMLCLLSFLCGLLSLLVGEVTLYGKSFPAGGILGQGIMSFLTANFDRIGSLLLLLSGLLIALMLLSDLSLINLWGKGRALLFQAWQWGKERLFRRQRPITVATPQTKACPPSRPRPTALENGEEALPGIMPTPGTPYHLPPLTLLRPKEAKESRVKKEMFVANARILEKTLADFGVSGHVTEIRPGPVITIYELEPAAGVKINRITTLADDLALALKAESIRIIAPLPGKGAMGIELPNPTREVVFLREVLDHEAFLTSRSKLPLGLGVDTVGVPVVTDLTRMPHLLIAGTTGSGKSVCLNTMICSVLFRATPEEVKFILIDPKRLELSSYEGIPHLLHPVVTDPKQAALVLRWAVEEMERRYALMAERGVRGIDKFNELGDEKSPTAPKLPYIVIVIDELADLMMVAQRNVEESLARIAQMARAAGIHLILATQRPSVDVITGVIKANFPTRISFQVSSKVDSRTILDQLGAEALLGNGDMLFLPPGTSKLTRIHGAFVSDQEIERIVAFIRQQGAPTYDETIGQWNSQEAEEAEEDSDYDEKYGEAVALVSDLGQASISLVQRYLKIGYNRAARIIERMEAEGIVSKAEGVKPRRVLLRKNPH